MNDEMLEQQLRALSAPELPVAWREEILASAIREARVGEAKRAVWPPLLISLRNIIARNPYTAGALTALWLLIILFKAGTPVDPSEKDLLAHFDPSRPVYLVSLQDEIRLAELAQEEPLPRPIP